MNIFFAKIPVGGEKIPNICSIVRLSDCIVVNAHWILLRWPNDSGCFLPIGQVVRNFIASHRCSDDSVYRLWNPIPNSPDFAIANCLVSYCDLMSEKIYYSLEIFQVLLLKTRVKEKINLTKSPLINLNSLEPGNPETRHLLQKSLKNYPCLLRRFLLSSLW